MSVLFSKVLKQALTTFDRKNTPMFKSNFNVLKQLMDQLTAGDLNLDTKLMSEDAFNQVNKAPCTFVHIFQNEDVAMSVFILRGDYTMPLHDHPMMHGILKALSGNILIKSYTKIFYTGKEEEAYPVNLKEFDTIAEIPKLIANNTESAILTPFERNYHEITAVGDVAAFFDILSPPYESDIPIYGRRKCSFYRKKIRNDSNEQILLERIPAPISYYCDTGDYDPPNFLIENRN